MSASAVLDVGACQAQTIDNVLIEMETASGFRDNFLLVGADSRCAGISHCTYDEPYKSGRVERPFSVAKNLVATIYLATSPSSSLSLASKVGGALRGPAIPGALANALNMGVKRQMLADPWFPFHFLSPVTAVA